jgi:uncharacterized protein involved in copper resistance
VSGRRMSKNKIKEIWIILSKTSSCKLYIYICTEKTQKKTSSAQMTLEYKWRFPFFYDIKRSLRDDVINPARTCTEKAQKKKSRAQMTLEYKWRFPFFYDVKLSLRDDVINPARSTWTEKTQKKKSSAQMT